ncbi:MAG TPA: conjugative transposon protein TraM [Pedobacter sp.]|uniref:conjugative transposon protein TraM n=1 Tax=Pedobacter sp. TaxID=1411316 RepID=UPI002C47927D|nr:conjugative transposon protein TraM [Pedobacter sp.]HMI04844.1 conjugative transposon protein TraM [Pedobacter sp.]
MIPDRFKKPKYVIPLIAFPFLCLFFYVYRLNTGEPVAAVKEKAGMQDQIGSVSTEVQKRDFEDKLDAFNQQYKEADGNSAVNPIEEQGQLDSIDRMMKERFSGVGSTGLPYASGLSAQQQGMTRMSRHDQELSSALAALKNGSYAGGNAGTYSGGNAGKGTYAAPVYESPPPVNQKDPMEMFKAQMAYMDSVSKASDPEYKAEQSRQGELKKIEELRKNQPKLEVIREREYSGVFNTLLPGKTESFITAVIDENITGYAGSRIRLRLLEDIRAGNCLVKKGTYLYALISGFGDQRVTLTVQSILFGGKILPVKLDIYDADGLPGLYVPESAFREFTKDLGGNSMQGVNLQGSNAGNQFLMSSIDKVFQSTSSAIASVIRKNKAKIKYNSYIYLIDPEALQNAQKNY